MRFAKALEAPGSVLVLSWMAEEASFAHASSVAKGRTKHTVAQSVCETSAAAGGVAVVFGKAR